MDGGMEVKKKGEGGMEKEKGSGGRGVLQVKFTYTIREGEANKKQHLLKTY